MRIARFTPKEPMAGSIRHDDALVSGSVRLALPLDRVAPGGEVTLYCGLWGRKPSQAGSGVWVA